MRDTGRSGCDDHAWFDAFRPNFTYVSASRPCLLYYQSEVVVGPGPLTSALREDALHMVFRICLSADETWVLAVTSALNAAGTIVSAQYPAHNEH